MKKPILIAVLFLSGGALFACEMLFTLDGKTVRPETLISLEAGTTHTLTVRFTEDHGSCLLRPEDTVFLVADEKWKPEKTALPLVLQGPVTWADVSLRVHETVITFRAARTGKVTLEIVRDCSRGGYAGRLIFMVT